MGGTEGEPSLPKGCTAVVMDPALLLRAPDARGEDARGEDARGTVLARAMFAELLAVCGVTGRAALG